MEINSGHSNVQIAIAVQPQSRSSRGQDVEYVSDNSGAAFNAVTQAEPSPSVNTSGQEVGNFVNTWA
jgi:hypothetical protein